MISISITLSLSLAVVFVILPVTYSALSCYTCDPCQTPWNPSGASITRTSGPNDYCRKIVTGSKVVKDYSSTCEPINALGNGVFCCQLDFCNSAQRSSMIHILLVIALITVLIYRKV